jgi:D-xylose 1-dehydrogenase (NADP+, D-xylono-1,5-lactone-forming)
MRGRLELDLLEHAMATQKSPLRIGVLGAANIARQFIAAVKPSALVSVTAVASRDAGKGAAFAKECGVVRSVGSYEALLADEDIDAIYNPLPNSLHAEWSIKASEAGKHVLCEKPLAINGAEARAMFDAARKHGRYLLEAYPYLAQPMTLKVRELVASGAIGQPQLIRASFGVPFSDPSNIRLKADLGGGSLMDAGSYAVSFARVIARARPTRVHAVAQWFETGVDKTLAATLEFENGLIAQVASSFGTGYHRHAQICGDRGSIDTMYLNHPPMGGPASIQVRRGPTAATELETIAVPVGNGFLAEAEEFARLVAGDAKAWTGATPEESVDIAVTLEALLKSARTGLAVDIAA